MISITSWLKLAIVTALVAIFYQTWLKDILFVILGIGRVVQPIEDFPYKCRRLQHKRLEACGDMWLDEPGRVLYAACAGVNARQEWNPSLSRFNVSGRRSGGSDMMAIYIDEPRKDGLFRMHRIQPTQYGNGPGDGRLDLSTFDVEVMFDPSTHRFWMLNHRALYDSRGNLDATQTGANTTIDVYEHRHGEKKMTHLATGWSPSFRSPNKVAFMGSNNFVVSDDRETRTGLQGSVDTFFHRGTLLYYDDWSNRYIMSPKRLPFLGSMLRGKDDRIYVSSLVDDRIRVFELLENRMFKQIQTIRMGMPIAGLSMDSSGAIWAVGRSKFDLTGNSSTNAIFKIEVQEGTKYQYVTSKIVEDGERKFISGASIARYDSKTKRIFIGGTSIPFLTMCGLDE